MPVDELEITNLVETVDAKTLTLTESIAAQYNFNSAKLEEIKTKYVGLKITGVNDKNGYNLVSTARKTVKEMRIEVEKRRKELKEESLVRGRAIDAEAKRLTAELEKVEGELYLEESRIDKMLEAEKAEKQRIINERINTRKNALDAVKAVYDYTKLATWDEADFQAHLKIATLAFEEAQAKAKAEEEARQAEEARKAEEERKRREELEAQEARNKAERAELDRIAREQREAQAKIEAQQAAIKAEQERIEREAREAKEAQERKEREAKIAAEAAERAKAEAAAQAKAEADKKEREERERAEREEAERKAAKAKLAAIEAAKPDAEKLKMFFSMFDLVNRPELKTEAAEKVLKTFEADLTDLIVRATIKAEGLIK